MKRDWDLIRRVLLAAETLRPQPPIELTIVGHDADEVSEHVHLCKEAEYVDAIEITGRGDRYRRFLVERLAWHGREFLDAIRDDDVWVKVLQDIRSNDGLPSTIVLDLARKYARKPLTPEAQG